MPSGPARRGTSVALTDGVATSGKNVKTVFILDDDPDAAELLAMGLAAPGRTVRAFADPVRALQAMESERTDLLIADLLMPFIDGERVLHSARERFPSVKLILVSGLTPQGPEAARREGVDFFTKPVDLDRLRSAVDRALA